MRKIFIVTSVYGVVILVTLSFVLWSCKPNRKDAKTVIPITHSAMLGGFITCDTSDYVFVKSTLTNTSTDTLQLVSMICSWPDEYKIDRVHFKFSLMERISKLGYKTQ